MEELHSHLHWDLLFPAPVSSHGVFSVQKCPQQIAEYRLDISESFIIKIIQDVLHV